MYGSTYSLIRHQMEESGTGRFSSGSEPWPSLDRWLLLRFGEEKIPVLRGLSLVLGGLRTPNRPARSIIAIPTTLTRLSN